VKIALACPYAWDVPGGVQVHVGQLGEHLQKRGHEVVVVAPGSREASEPWVRIVGRPMRVRYQGTVAPICFSPYSARVIGSVLRGFAPDVVHAHEPFSPSTSMIATLRSRAPVVATFHAFAERSRLLTVAAPALRLVWRRLRVRLAVSEAAAGFIRSRFGDGIRIVPNGCDVELFGKAGTKPAPGLPAGRRMLWVGRLDAQKGFPIAVAAFRRIASEVPDLSFVVVGEGRDRPAVSSLPPDVRRRMVMAGTVGHQSLPGYYAGADVFVSPAVGQESFGLVLVEAMAAGVPVVASDIAGYREVVRANVDGLLVPRGDPGSLAEEVLRVLSDPGLASRLSEAGRARADRYRWDVVAGEIEAAYEDAIRR
jgi:phosphatidyl-myo-inositol alpha-mannosyltransferase